MSIPATIATTLDHAGIDYRLLTHRHVSSLEDAARDCALPPEQLIRAVLLKDTLGVMLAIVPLNHALDFVAINQLTGRNLKPADVTQTSAVFTDCEPGSVPPLARPYRVSAIIDEAVANLSQLCFEPGDRRLLICMSGDDFLGLHTKSLPARISHPQQSLSSCDNQRFHTASGPQQLQQLRPLGGMAERINHLKHLPPIPAIASQLLRLHKDNSRSIDALCAIIAQAPYLTEQLLSSAVAPKFSSSSEAPPLHALVAQHLGFDAALNMALAIIISHHFQITREGPLGLNAFWRQAHHSAALAETLARQLSPHLEVDPAMAHLAGLLHHVGYLAMGQQMQSEFYLLNKLASANPEVSIPQLEKQLLGIGHTHIGAWLMRAWQMPEEIITTVREHHNELHRGKHAPYVHLMIVVGCLLKSYGIGDAPSRSVPPGSLTLLGLDLRLATELTEQLIHQADSSSSQPSQLCA